MAKLLKSLTTKIKKEDGTTTENEYTVAHEWKHLGESETGGDTLTWDGNTEGLYYNENMPFQYHVSDIVLTVDDLANGGSFVVGGVNTDFTLDGAVMNDGNGFIMMDAFMIIPTDNYVFDELTFEKKGIYLMSDSGSVCTSLTINGYTGFPMVKPIDTKYLPKHLQFGESKVELLNGTYEFTFSEEDGMYLNVQELTIDIHTFNNIRVMWDGVEYNNVARSEQDGMLMFGNYSMDIGGLPFMGLIGDGMVVFVDINATTPVTRTIELYLESIKQVDNKFISLNFVDITCGKCIFKFDEAKGYEYFITTNDGTLYKLQRVGDYVSLSELDGKYLYFTSSNGSENALGLNELKTNNGKFTRICGLFLIETREIFDNGVVLPSGTYLGETTTTIANQSLIAKSFGIYDTAFKLPEYFIPEFSNNLIIKSSTSGSSKKFRITVDDNGTLSATEITG